MTWTYSGDPTNNPIDQLRFLLGDTEENMAQLTDEEIQFLLNKYENPLDAAISAAKGLAAKYAKYVDYTIGPESVKAGERSKAFAALAAALTADKVGLSNAAPSMANPHRPIFGIGLDDNRNLGGVRLDGRSTTRTGFDPYCP